MDRVVKLAWPEIGDIAPKGHGKCRGANQSRRPGAWHTRDTGKLSTKRASFPAQKQGRIPPDLADKRFTTVPASPLPVARKTATTDCAIGTEV